MHRLLARFLVFGLAGGVLLPLPARACIWDSDTLAMERAKSPQLEQAILGEAAPAPDTTTLGERITRLLARRRENDPAWWNDLAGAHIRLGEPQQAVELLEPVVKRFPNDYGIHANLGTAYHLLGRYREAEREIARDLELNPEAHFGLERYHLALLQYLVRDRKYQSRHVYVDEWSHPLMHVTVPYLDRPAGKPKAGDPWRGLDRGSWVSEDTTTPVDRVQSARESLKKARASTRKDRNTEIENAEVWLAFQQSVAQMLADPPPPYRSRWDLASDPKFEEGVVYLASLNPQQPACVTMLGVAALHRRDLNLAVSAFERAIDLGSPQSKLLQEWVTGLREHIRDAQKHNPPQPARKPVGPILAGITAICALGLVGIRLHFRRRRRRAA